MKANWLFPYQYRLIGWLILIPSVVLGLATMYWEISFNFLTLPVPMSLTLPLSKSNFDVNFTNEVAALGVILGLLLVAFAREREEDEMISQLRLESLQWSLYANYLLLGIAILLIHGFLFLEVMTYNMFTVLIVFIIRFRLLLRRYAREMEEAGV